MFGNCCCNIDIITGVVSVVINEVERRISAFDTDDQFAGLLDISELIGEYYVGIRIKTSAFGSTWSGVWLE